MTILHNYLHYSYYYLKWIVLELVARTSEGTGARASPTFINGWARGNVDRRKANKKLTKPYLPSRKCLSKRLLVLLEPKKWRGTTKIFSNASVPPTFAPDRCPNFKIHSGATGRSEWQGHFFTGSRLCACAVKICPKLTYHVVKSQQFIAFIESRWSLNTTVPLVGPI